MQIIFLPDWITIVSYIVLWPLFQVAISIWFSRIDARLFEPGKFWLTTRKWERNGTLYMRIFKIHRWKHLLPDGAKAHKKGFHKKYLKSYDPEYIKEFINETGRAETGHWLQIIPFWVFGLWSPSFVIWIMLGYALLVNLPCIIAQRYNRPRLIKSYYYLKSRREMMK